MFIGIAVLFYLFGQIFIGYLVSKNIKNDDDYFLAGRSLGIGLASLSLFATWFGAETCIGSAAGIFAHGLSGSRADPFGYTICLLLMAFFLATQLWKMNITTLGDFFGIRFGPRAEKLAVIVLLPTSIIWAAAQVRAFGQIVSTVSPLDPVWGVTLAAAFVIVYTFMGGLLGDVITDVIQGGFLILGLSLLLYFGLDQVGGVAEAWKSIDPSKLSFVGHGESLWARIDTWMVPILGSLVAQELISRVLATRSSQVAFRSSALAAFMYLVIGLIPVAIGLIGPRIVSAEELSDPDQFMPFLASKILPPTFYVLFVGALISAILSTVDSTLLTISAFWTHNIMGKKFYRLEPAKRVLWSRWVVVVAGVVSYLLALSADNIYGLVQYSSSFGSAGVLVVTLVGLWAPARAHDQAAIWTLIAGLALTPVYDHVLNLEAPFLMSILSCMVTYFLSAQFLENNIQASSSS